MTYFDDMTTSTGQNLSGRTASIGIGQQPVVFERGNSGTPSKLFGRYFRRDEAIYLTAFEGAFYPNRCSARFVDALSESIAAQAISWALILHL